MRIACHSFRLRAGDIFANRELTTVSSDHFANRQDYMSNNLLMDTLQIIGTAVIALGGLYITVWTSVRAASDSRAGRFDTRASALFSRADTLRIRGPFFGWDSYDFASRKHEQLLVDLEREARANVVLHLRAAARLARPGSLFVAISLFGYSLLTILTAIEFAHAGSGAVEATDVATVKAVVSTFVVLSVVLLVLSGLQIRRRITTRSIRAQIGEVDDLTRAGWVRQIAALREVAHVARQFVSEKHRARGARLTKSN
jgi:hypothetical protein